MARLTDWNLSCFRLVARLRAFGQLATLAVAVLTATLPCDAVAGDPFQKSVDFNFEVRPILSDKCFKCHGPDPRIRKAGLRLDTKDGVFGTTDSGSRAVVPGDLEQSELISRITASDKSERMPPESLGRTLSASEIELLKRWVKEGATWQAHWSFLTPAAAARPKASDRAWPRNAIDHFVLARLEAERLSPAREAARETLIRRLTFDLIGLPPTVAEVDDFLADQSPYAYDRLVDRLLDSPRFGERMAIDWLDLARYADTYGYQADVYRAMWPWRDWVVQAWNGNLPYDQFVTWQLAGDLVPQPARSQILATAFNRHHRQTNEGGSIEEEFRVEYVADRTNTFATAFLGLTLECARCHSHKYDPITQTEYYQLFSFFNSIDESGLYSHFTNAVPTPTLLLTPAHVEQSLAELKRKIKAAEADLQRLAETRLPAFQAWLSSSGRELALPGLIGDYPLESIESGQVANRAQAKRPGHASEGPELVEGRVGKAIRLSGENNVTLALGNFDRFQPFSVALWIKTPDFKDRAVVLHRSMSWTDAGSRGYQLLIEEGKLSFGLIHFWPGNAIAKRATEPLALDRWTHVAVSYDGSSRASGLALYLNGQRAPTKVVRDNLTKTITGGGNDQITIGQRFRDRGFKNGLVDEIKVFDRALTALEVAHVCNGTAPTKPDATARLSASERADLMAYYLSAVDGEFQQQLAALTELRKQQAALVDPVAEIMVMKELQKERPTYLLKRGSYEAPAGRVERGTPASLPPFTSALPRNRLGLAQWLIDPNHPLTARVAVNRWWQALFGRGIVSTPEDFGSQGQLPSHPELLDWLARTLIDGGWDVKRVLRLIVTSATYRQSSHAPGELLARDPENILLARGPRFRLPAEMLRDSALAASGLLVGTIGGPPVKPYQPPGLWEEKSGLAYERDRGAGSHRRSLYTFWKRTSPPPSMLTFDATTREFCAVKRQTTATPLQALVLLNDPQYVEAARALAQRAFREGGTSLASRITFAFRTLTGRLPNSRELATLEALVREQVDEFRSGQSDARKLIGVGDAHADLALDPAECAAMTVMVQALLNFQDTVVNN
jgi:hypothetical protein